jgi:hypothetical protein
MRFVDSSLRRFIVSFTFILILMTVIGVVSAQDDSGSVDTCNIDLSGTVATLVQAQAAASAGNVEEAQSLIAEAQSALDEAATFCETGGDSDPAESFELTESYTSTNERTFSFSFPEGWVVADEDDRVSIANSQELLEGDFFAQSEPGTLNEGEYVGLLQVQDPVRFGIEELVGSEPTASEFLDGIREQLLQLGSMNEINAVETINIGASEAALVTAYADGSAIVILLSPITSSETYIAQSLFQFIAIAGAPDDVETVRQLTIDIAEHATDTSESTTASEPASTPENVEETVFELTEKFDYLGERAFIFSYPETWLAVEDEDHENEVIFATNQELVDSDFFYQSSPAPVDEGEYVGLVALETTREFGIFDIAGATPTAIEFAEALSTQLSTLPNIERVDEVETFEIDGRELALMTVHGDGYSLLLTVELVGEVSELADDLTENLFVLVGVAGSPDNIETARVAALAIAESASVPVPETE